MSRWSLGKNDLPQQNPLIAVALKGDLAGKTKKKKKKKEKKKKRMKKKKKKKEKKKKKKRRGSR